MKFKISNDSWLTMSKILFVLSLSLPASANTVVGKVTHSISVPSSGYLNDPINISWSPLPGFSFADFSFVKIGYRLNGGGYTFLDQRGSGTSISLNQTGRWCFIVRGWNSNEGEFGLFNINNEQCVEIRDLPVPSAPTFEPHEYYQPVNKGFVLKWNPQSGGRHVSHYKLNGAYFSGNSKELSFAHYGRQSLSVQACNSQNKCSSSTTTSVYIYSPPGFVRSLAADRTHVKLGEGVNITWNTPGGMVHNGYYRVSLNGRVLYSGKNLYYNPSTETPGKHIYKVGACNPELPCTESNITIQVSSPSSVSGSASFIHENNGNTILDPYYNKNELLAWDVSAVKNASQYQVIVEKSGSQRIFPATKDGNLVKFRFSQHMSNYRTNDEVKVSLSASNSAGQSAVLSSKENITLVNWDEIEYFNGTPLHIVGAAMEANKYKSTVFNKLWKTIPQTNSLDEATHLYDIDPTLFFDAYFHTYQLPSNLSSKPRTEPVMNVSRPLFDGFAFWDNILKKSPHFADATRFTNVLSTDNILNKFNSGANNSYLRGYLDTIFRIKNKASKPNNKYLFKNEKSLLAAMHESADRQDPSTGVASSKSRGFYVMLPAPYYKVLTTDEIEDGIENPYPFIEEEFKKRFTVYIDEVIEQYALWRSKYPNSKVKLAGFIHGSESSDRKTLGLIRHLKSHIKSFSPELELVASGYRKGPDLAQTFEESCSDRNSDLEKCLIKYTQIYDVEINNNFDKVWLQPNATLERFTSHTNRYMGISSFERELLHWYGKGVLERVKNDPKYSLVFEYTRNFANGRESSRDYFGYQTRIPEQSHSFSNYIHSAFNARFKGDSYKGGYYGDISYYADYIATDFPPQYSNGSKSFLYDDNGGLFFCYVQYAIGKSDGCDAISYHQEGGKDYIYTYDLVESISDVRAMYSFIGTTRGFQKYSADNKIKPATPLNDVNVNQSITIDITENVANARYLSFNTLVRSRLHPYLQKGSAAAISNCSAKPVVTFTFKDDSNNQIGSPSYLELGQEILQQKACRNIKDLVKTLEDEETKRINNERLSKCGPVVDSDTYRKCIKNINPEYVGEARTTSLWEPLSTRIALPYGTKKVSIKMETKKINTLDYVKSFVFYRPDYQLE
ncbi:hypothetical protein [Pseudoalteromonas rubra]|uniref:hypothetical protein n=1 Tax=Pseudoalteromonas rubra TaxID=43658 RepID=UPI0012FBAC21|nr:hypothetical protein [Pseudoalteromonas rubra]